MCMQGEACQCTVVDVVGGLQPSSGGCQGEQTGGVQTAETGWWVQWVSASFSGVSCSTDGGETAFRGTRNTRRRLKRGRKRGKKGIKKMFSYCKQLHGKGGICMICITWCLNT